MSPTIQKITILSPALHMSWASANVEGFQKGYSEDWSPLLQWKVDRHDAEWVTAETACAECCGKKTDPVNEAIWNF